MPGHHKSSLGACVFGGAAIFLGVVGLASGDFATGWQRVEPSVPHRALLADIAAICEIAGGAGILWRRTACFGAGLLAILYAIFVLSWLQKAVSAPLIYDSWGNVFEELSLLLAALVLFASASPRESLSARSQAPISRIYGVCPISFALVHFIYLRGAASWVPAWLPPGQVFWTIATAVCFLLAAAAILSGVLAALAAQLLTAEIIGFEILIWIPKLLAAPHTHFVWAGNGISLAMSGAAWVVADSLNASSRREPQHPAAESPPGSSA
jgi:uncharacterized membrane protein YphA (DoxX/SURF4 family)